MSDGPSQRKSKRLRPAALTKTSYLVVWWMSQKPYAAVFGNRIAAEAAANVRNAILVTVCGDVDIPEIVDWYRRDPEGRPMPAEWRDLAGQVRIPWKFKTIDQPEVEATA